MKAKKEYKARVFDPKIKTNKKINKNPIPAETLDLAVLIQEDEDGLLVATVPALPGCFTGASNMRELRKNIAEAIELYLENENLEKFPNLKFKNVMHYKVTHA
ncbi:MAG: type II toxin-antitoxin system HicB family antitoxin [Leptospiraceae bacterium]|nr:type II toxin-antitoxin system HicB family antitoxin [Leptospiraceae bacterium]MCB1202002.1 type II toxin-antitoxin system HicB family antitoxin [Leptospiraceae bacterium]